MVHRTEFGVVHRIFDVWYRIKFHVAHRIESHVAHRTFDVWYRIFYVLHRIEFDIIQ